MSKKLKYKDLKPGMLTKHELIIDSGVKGTSRFFKNSGWVKAIPLADPYWGVCLRQAILAEDFVIWYEKGSKEYKEVIHELICKRLDAVKDAEKDVDMLKAYIS